MFFIDVGFFYISSLEKNELTLDNAAVKNKPTNLILLIVTNENPASCKRSNFVSIRPVKTINTLMITVIFDLFIVYLRLHILKSCTYSTKPSCTWNVPIDVTAWKSNIPRVPASVEEVGAETPILESIYSFVISDLFPSEVISALVREGANKSLLVFFLKATVPVPLAKIILSESAANPDVLPKV